MTTKEQIRIHPTDRKLKFWCYAKKANVSTARLVLHEARRGYNVTEKQIHSAVRKATVGIDVVDSPVRRLNFVTEDQLDLAFILLEDNLSLSVEKVALCVGAKNNEAIYSECQALDFILEKQAKLKGKKKPERFFPAYMKHRQERRVAQWKAFYLDTPYATHATVAERFGVGERTVQRIFRSRGISKPRYRAVGFRPKDAFVRDHIYLVKLYFHNQDIRLKLGITVFKNLNRRFKKHKHLIRKLEPRFKQSGSHLDMWCIESELLEMWHDFKCLGPQEFAGKFECFLWDESLLYKMERLINPTLKALEKRRQWLESQPKVGLLELMSDVFLAGLDVGNVPPYFFVFLQGVLTRRKRKLARTIKELGLKTVVRYERSGVWTITQV